MESKICKIIPARVAPFMTKEKQAMKSSPSSTSLWRRCIRKERLEGEILAEKAQGYKQG